MNIYIYNIYNTVTKNNEKPKIYYIYTRIKTFINLISDLVYTIKML